MVRLPTHITIEKDLIEEIDTMHTTLKQRYRVSKSDIMNEIISYGIPIVKIRHKLGNEKLDEIYNVLNKMLKKEEW
jgi:hypothetical protein